MHTVSLLFLILHKLHNFNVLGVRNALISCIVCLVTAGKISVTMDTIEELFRINEKNK